ncbi:hypothetical protein LEP1GSC024_2538 [Leptospira noguchii str. 2001034031]|uniref:Uncharacterized protein n=1 Tax=Leptospira noguchii str. 2001034031 TaxID=1193053 RepID=M6YD29_9LEPT|nr:hypothetical protein LEP1GSC024_2538 [Leptospira noguchii str. 2001034031]
MRIAGCVKKILKLFRERNFFRSQTKKTILKNKKILSIFLK